MREKFLDVPDMAPFRGTTQSALDEGRLIASTVNMPTVLRTSWNAYSFPKGLFAAAIIRYVSHILHTLRNEGFEFPGDDVSLRAAEIIKEMTPLANTAYEPNRTTTRKNA